MTIATGQKLPDATFTTPGADGVTQISSADLFAGKKVVLFGVPGAFTPTCNNNHLPGYLENADAIKAKGVDEIAVVAVNDVFVMKAWANSTGADGKITFLADGSAKFVQDAGLAIDLTERGMGMRSKRFSMIVDDGVVTALNIEDVPSNAVASGAATLMEQL
jgi:peroxiredoxin